MPNARRRASQFEALAVLHPLAPSPSTAGDALALLHELQVLQVELDLQQGQLRRPQAELETALVRQAGLVERAPAGEMTIDARTVLCEIKRAGARLLGAAPDGVLGRPLAVFVAAPALAQCKRFPYGHVPAWRARPARCNWRRLGACSSPCMRLPIETPHRGAFCCC